VTVPPLNRSEIRDLAERLGILAAFGGTAERGQAERTDAAVTFIHERSRGNALYATYLCRQAVGPAPALDDQAPRASADPLDRLRDVPASAQDLDDYYAYLFSGLTDTQRHAVGLLAVCDFAVTAEELREIFPAAAPILPAALTAVAPIVAQQPRIGGLKIHHESFSRFVRRYAGDEAWVTTVRTAAEWLAERGFFADARAFRHLPELLVELDRDDDLASLIRLHMSDIEGEVTMARKRGAMTAPTPTKVWSYAHSRSWRRARRVSILAPIAMLAAVPGGIFHHNSLIGLGKSLVQIASIADELMSDARRVRRGDPIVICGTIAAEEPSEFDKEFAAALSDERSVFTFGYELTIDVKWAARIARNGDLTEYPDLMGSNTTVRSSRHVFRNTYAEQDVVLLCNHAGTALAVESEIPDPDFVNVVREA
jgi:hypothetical protein